MIGILVAIITGGAAISYGASTGTVESVSTLFMGFCTIFLPLTVGGVLIDLSKNKELNKQLKDRRTALETLAGKYNAIIDMLEESYKKEKRSLGIFSPVKKSSLRRKYEKQYLQNQKAYEADCKLLFAQKGKDSAMPRSFKRYWKMIITIGLICQTGACCYTTGTLDRLMPEPLEAPVTQSNENTPAWTADNIPMPHLTDGSRYVSNPDQVVTPHTEKLLNEWLKRLDDSLQIESAMIIVNHIENEDPFRFAQDIFDKYKVGKDDRGLVIVLAYQDHKVRTHTGRSLEGDLTDIECSRLQETYAIPSMKAEQPDSGMLYLTEAIYNTLKGKELPMTEYQRLDLESDEVAEYMALFMLLYALWVCLILFLRHRYYGTSGRSFLHPNPFVAATTAVVTGGGSRGGGFGGGGGFSGGGFSGGSSGGGGATSSW